MTDETITCSCCGVPVFGKLRQRARVCSVCDICDTVHGHARHQQVITLIARGVLTAWDGIACCAFDDAWLAGKAEITEAGDFVIPRAVKRWEVVIGWARCRRVDPPFDALVGAALAPYLGLPNVQRVRDLISDDIKQALCTADPEIVDVMVSTQPHSSISEEIDIKIQAKAPILSIVFEGSLPQDLPADILSRPRGQA